MRAATYLGTGPLFLQYRHRCPNLFQLCPALRNLPQKSSMKESLPVWNQFTRQRTPPRELIFDKTLGTYPADVFHTWETGTTYHVTDDELAQALGVNGVYKK